MALLKNHLARFDALGVRERAAVSLLVLVIVFLFFYLLFIEPQKLKTEMLKQQLVNSQMQERASDQQIALLQKRLGQDPDEENRKLFDRLKKQDQKIVKQLQLTMHGLIAPEQMAQVLESVLTQTTKLKLESLNNLPMRPLLSVLEKENTANGTQAAVDDVGVYQHGMQIEFRGTYLDMLAYLEALKSLPWNFYWDSIEMATDRYPQAQIILTVHTLSFAPGWIGV